MTWLKSPCLLPDGSDGQASAGCLLAFAPSKENHHLVRRADQGDFFVLYVVRNKCFLRRQVFAWLANLCQCKR